MARCQTCGNMDGKTFEVTFGHQTHTFDSFQCAIQALAPICPHCGCKIIGHGFEENEVLYCCAHCASESGAYMFQDRG